MDFRCANREYQVRYHGGLLHTGWSWFFNVYDIHLGDDFGYGALLIHLWIDDIIVLCSVFVNGSVSRNVNVIAPSYSAHFIGLCFQLVFRLLLCVKESVVVFHLVKFVVKTIK